MKINKCLFCGKVPKIVHTNDSDVSKSYINTECECGRWVKNIIVINDINKAEDELVSKWNKIMEKEIKSWVL